MFVKKKRAWDSIPSSEITSESHYLNRRQFMGASLAFAAGAAVRPQDAAASVRRFGLRQDPEVGNVT